MGLYLYLVSYTVPIVILDALHHKDLTEVLILESDKIQTVGLVVDTKEDIATDLTIERSIGNDSKTQIGCEDQCKKSKALVSDCRGVWYSLFVSMSVLVIYMLP